MLIAWAVAFAVFVVAELATVGLVSIWFALGSAAAFLAALLNAQIWLQVVLFLAVSALTLILTRPFAKKYLDSRKRPTNADRVFEMTAVVTEEIDNLKGTGLVKVDGKVWTARSYGGEIIKTGAVVIPREIEGVKLIVSPASENAEINL